MKVMYEDNILEYERIFRDDGHFITGMILCVQITFEQAETGIASALAEGFKLKVESAAAAFLDDYQIARVITASGDYGISLTVEATLLREEKRKELYLALKQAVETVLSEVSHGSNGSKKGWIR